MLTVRMDFALIFRKYQVFRISQLVLLCCKIVCKMTVLILHFSNKAVDDDLLMWNLCCVMQEVPEFVSILYKFYKSSHWVFSQFFSLMSIMSIFLYRRSFHRSKNATFVTRMPGSYGYKSTICKYLLRVPSWDSAIFLYRGASGNDRNLFATWTSFISSFSHVIVFYWSVCFCIRQLQIYYVIVVCVCAIVCI